MALCARALPALFLQINLMLMIYTGAGLATAARLKWDPTTYVALREVLPHVYRAATVTLLVASLMLLVMAHLALAAVYARSARRLLMVLYAVLMAIAVTTEIAWMWWTSARVGEWLHSSEADDIMHALQLKEHLAPLLQALAHWHPLPQKLNDIIKEAEADFPCNGYVVMAALVLLVLLQPTATVLALLLAARASTVQHADHSSSDSERRALRAVYKNGRLVMV